MPTTVTIGTDDETQEELWIGDRERCGGLYVLGKPRTGKSHLLKSLALQDTENDHGFLFIDPHADAINDMIERLPMVRRKDDILLLDPTDEAYAFGINPLYCRNPQDMRERQLSFGQAWDVFSKVFGEEDGRLGILLSRYLGNCLYPLIENQGCTLYDIWSFLQNKAFRDALLRKVNYHVEVIEFWQDEFDQMPARDQREEIQSLLRRIDALRRNPYIKHVISQPIPKLDFAEVMQTKQIVLLRMPPWQDEESKSFIGTLVISQLLKTIFLRAEISEHLRTPFAIYCDEFQTFATPDFSKLFTQTGKFQIMPAVAHQERLGQFKPDDPNRGATLAAPNKVLFSLTVHDSDELAPEVAGQADDVKTRVGGELVIAPQSVEDIWEQGHPDTVIMDIRQRYFWIVDLLKSKPQEKYFKFDPKSPPVGEEHPDGGKLHWHDFADWDMYRSSAEMLNEGISLLNQYYYRRMHERPFIRNNYKDHLKTDEELSLILRVIESLGGVFGFRPTMRPFLPAEKSILLRNAWRKYRIQKMEEALQPTKDELYGLREPNERSYQYGRSDPMFWKAMGEYWQRSRELSEDIQRRRGFVEVWLENEKFHRHISLEEALKYRFYAVQAGIPPHEAENLVEWEEAGPMKSPEKEYFAELVKLFANINADRDSFEKNASQIYEKYVTLIAHPQMVGMYGEQYEELLSTEAKRPYLNKVTERTAWQMNHLREFINYLLNYCPAKLESQPVKLSSGHYDETPRRERTQSEVIVETAQELTNLPRQTAYAKVIQEEDGKQIVVKRKIKPLALPKEHGLPLASEILARSHALVYKPREEIEAEIRQRQEQWRRPPDSGTSPRRWRRKPPPTVE